jgi:hypothetical protein
MNKVLEDILEQYAGCDEVQAIAIGGSSAAKTSDNISDIDIYVFVTRDISLEFRQKLVEKYSSKFEVGGEYFGSGDEYYVDELGMQLDVMFWNVDWFDSVVSNTWEKFYPSNGYSTCFLYTLKNFQIVCEKDGYLTNLKQKIDTPFPQELKNNIIKRNTMLLKDKPFASYYEQLGKAIKRGDEVSINHRISAFLASYFDIIFAKNELLHPGEKRLVKFAVENCKSLPKDFEPNIEKLLNAHNSNILPILDEIVGNLREIL